MLQFQVLSTNSYVVAYEVVLSIQRLVKKYGKDLQHVEWNIILDILESLLRMIEVYARVSMMRLDTLYNWNS